MIFYGGRPYFRFPYFDYAGTDFFRKREKKICKAYSRFWDETKLCYYCYTMEKMGEYEIITEGRKEKEKEKSDIIDPFKPDMKKILEERPRNIKLKNGYFLREYIIGTWVYSRGDLNEIVYINELREILEKDSISVKD